MWFPECTIVLHDPAECMLLVTCETFMIPPSRLTSTPAHVPTLLISLSLKNRDRLDGRYVPLQNIPEANGSVFESALALGEATRDNPVTSAVHVLTYGQTPLTPYLLFSELNAEICLREELFECGNHY